MGSILHDIRHAKDLKQQQIRDKIELAGQFSGYESGQAAGEIISEIVSFIGPTKLAKIAGKSKLVSRLSQVPKIEKGLSYIKQARTMLSDNYLSRLARESYGATKDFFRSRLGNLWDDFSLKKFSPAGLDKFRYGEDIGKHTARLYQSTGESAEFQRIRQKLYGEASEQSGRKVGREFSKEASEQLAKHDDEVAKGAKEAAEQTGKKVGKEFSKEASEQLAKHSDDVAKGAKEAAEQAGKKARQEFSKEASEQLAKHSDEVARNVAETGKRAADNFADDIGGEIPRLDEVSVEFKYKDKFNKKEFSRQLKGQQDGLNDLTVQEYFDNCERYLKEGRSKEARKAQKAARKKVLQEKIDKLMDSGMSRKEAKEGAKEWMKEQAALHNPDQIAGGDPTKISGMGDRRVNSSLGSQWKTRIDAMDEQIRKLAEGLSPEELRNTYLNIKLTY